MALEQETAYFEEKKAEWLQHYTGQFALVHGDELLGTFTQFDEAFDAGVKRLGNQPFLIKQIVETETPVQFPALVVGMIGARS
jgi:hypothetical protein